MTDKLADAMAEMARATMGIDCGGTFDSMSCTEAESFAAALAHAGHLEAAGHLLMMHAEGDSDGPNPVHGDRGDQHHGIYLAIQDAGGFSHDEDDAPFGMAMARVREILAG